MARLACSLGVAEVEAEFGVALVRDLVVDDGRAGDGGGCPLSPSSRIAGRCRGRELWPACGLDS
jgi:hypothetical protein